MRRIKEIQSISPELLESLINKYSPEYKNPNIALQNLYLVLKEVVKDRKALLTECAILRSRAEVADHKVKKIIKICANDD